LHQEDHVTVSVELIDAVSPKWSAFLTRAAHDFYHLPGYAALCARQEGGEARAICVQDGSRMMLLPLVLRRLGDANSDASSPYGYPGPLMTGVGADSEFLADALRHGMEELGAHGIVSLFVRFHPLLNRTPPADVGTVVRHGDTVAIDLSLPAELQWEQTRRNHRQQIAQAMATGSVFGVDTGPELRAAFKHMYRSTMSRVAANPYYVFDDAYFDSLESILGDQLHYAGVEVDGAIAAAAIFVDTCSIVQMHLVGHDGRVGRRWPTKLLFHGVRGWAKDHGARWLHLGGGRSAEVDSLFHFKAGFSPLRRPFHTLRAVILQEEYGRLIAARDQEERRRNLDGPFPEYRHTRRPSGSGHHRESRWHSIDQLIDPW
jgi:hypothetical protein